MATAGTFECLCTWCVHPVMSLRVRACVSWRALLLAWVCCFDRMWKHDFGWVNIMCTIVCHNPAACRMRVHASHVPCLHVRDGRHVSCVDVDSLQLCMIHHPNVLPDDA